jgi:hypothetical protein
MATQALAPIDSGNLFAHDVAVDGAGNTYITGDFIDSFRFGTTIFQGIDFHTYIAKLDGAGNYQWLVPLATGRGGPVGTTSLAVDAAGNVCVAGSFFGSLTFGTTTLTSVGRS